MVLYRTLLAAGQNIQYGTGSGTLLVKNSLNVDSVLCLVQEGEDFENEEASPNKRKKDPHKVDKKYLWPHGLGPPLKNCRKRRFRKTRKKKYVEAPEIEKEVRHSSVLMNFPVWASF